MNEYAVRKLKVIKTIEGNKKIDWDKFNSGKYVLITRWCYDEWYQDEDMYVNFFEPGDKINLTSQAPEYEVMKEVKEQSGYSYSYATYEGHPWEEYEVYGIVEIPQELGMRSFGDFCLNYVLPENDYISLNGNRGMLRTILDVDNNKVDEYNTWFNNYVENVNTELSVKSKESEIGKYEHINKMIRVIGLFLALILGFIGLMNFANTIVTSIIVRSRELAMLSAVGMTKKQQNRRLMKEGAVYFVWTAIMSVIITSILSLTVLKPFMSIFPMFDWQFTLLPIAISLPFILLLVVSIPRITYNKLSKNSIADRLREQ
jgi:putative ABC transport system permease protein